MFHNDRPIYLKCNTSSGKYAKLSNWCIRYLSSWDRSDSIMAWAYMIYNISYVQVSCTTPGGDLELLAEQLAEQVENEQFLHMYGCPIWLSTIYIDMHIIILGTRWQRVVQVRRSCWCRPRIYTTGGCAVEPKDALATSHTCENFR